MERIQLITQLSASLNKFYGSRITIEMMECWVGADATNADIQAHINELEHSDGKKGVTPWDVLDTLDDDKDYGYVEED